MQSVRFGLVWFGLVLFCSVLFFFFFFLEQETRLFHVVIISIDQAREGGREEN